MRRLLLVLVLIIGGLVARAPSSWACSCVQITIGDQYRLADAVFVGNVSRVSSADARGNVIATIAVSDVYKGPVPQTANVRTARDGASCGVSFAVGTRYAVFARGTTPFEANICGGTTTDVHALERARANGPVVSYRSPIPKAHPPVATRTSRTGPIAGAALLIALVVAGGWVFWRSRTGRAAGGAV
jgi:hypothetical protein